MRGDDRRPDTMFSYVAPEQRVPADHPLRAIRTMVDTALRELSPEFRSAVPEDGSSVDPAREAAPRLAGADAVLGPERAPAHGAAGLQPPLPLVRGPQLARELGSYSRTLADGRYSWDLVAEMTERIYSRATV